MQKYGIPACYYPTTVIFVDDSQDFLMNFSLQLDPGLAYQLYTAPDSALDTINSQHRELLDQKCFSHNSEVTGNPSTTHTIKVDISSIHREVYDPHRFNEISVVVVDFAMPDINGLEFCKKLMDKPVKKILLTGQADAQTAIDAFNAGIIDHFILKSDPHVIEKVNSAICELQQRYFQEKSDFMVKALAIDSPNFLQDPIFYTFFTELCRQHDLVEYYLTENTGTFLLLSANADAKWLIVCLEQDLKMYIELGEDLNASRSVIERLIKREAIPHFWHVDRYYQVDPIEWESYLYPCKRLSGREEYYYTLIDNPSISRLDTDGILSYNNYLEHLDYALVSEKT
ncbi:MAG: response regulator [Legionellales bacterium]|nr:response regulator [Legionellales bacterium]